MAASIDDTEVAKPSDGSAVFADPDEVVIGRRPNRHTSFGRGAHRCTSSNPGALRVPHGGRTGAPPHPDSRLMPGAQRYASTGAINGSLRLPIEFEPQARTGPERLAHAFVHSA